jgi:hypothetical protein
VLLCCWLRFRLLPFLPCGCGWMDGCDSDLRSTRTAAAATGCCCAISERRGEGKIKTSAAQQSNTASPKLHQNTNKKTKIQRTKIQQRHGPSRECVPIPLRRAVGSNVASGFFLFRFLLGPNAARRVYGCVQMTNFVGCNEWQGGGGGSDSVRLGRVGVSE